MTLILAIPTKGPLVFTRCFTSLRNLQGVQRSTIKAGRRL
jgi:hypothetical protein